MSTPKKVHIQITPELWKKINVERMPNQSIEETLEVMLDERTRLRKYVKADPNLELSGVRK